jgi:hypothetical protein
MHRRFPLIVALGVVFLTTITHGVLAAGPSPDPSKSPPKSPPTTASTTTTTTSPPPQQQPPPQQPPPQQPPPQQPPPNQPPPNKTPTSCSPNAKHEAAPKIGSTTNYKAGEGGSADINRTGPTQLQVTAATASPGWSNIVFTPSGQSVRVKYTDNNNPRHFVRLVISLNNSGTEIHVRTTTCQ